MKCFCGQRSDKAQLRILKNGRKAHFWVCDECEGFTLYREYKRGLKNGKK